MVPSVTCGIVFISYDYMEKGRKILNERIQAEAQPLEEFLEGIEQSSTVPSAGDRNFHERQRIENSASTDT